MDQRVLWWRERQKERDRENQQYKRIKPEQIEYNGEDYFVGIVRDFKNKKGIIYHDIDLDEESIVHELLHVKNPKKDEDWVNMVTNQLLKNERKSIKDIGRNKI